MGKLTFHFQKEKNDSFGGYLGSLPRREMHLGSLLLPGLPELRETDYELILGESGRLGPSSNGVEH